MEESNKVGDSLLVFLNQPMRGKGGKQALECPKVDKTFETQEEKINQKEVDKTSKEFFALLDTFRAFVVWQNKATSQNNEITRFMGQIVEGLNVIGTP